MAATNGLANSLQAPALDWLFAQVASEEQQATATMRAQPPSESAPRSDLEQILPRGWPEPPAALEKVPEFQEAMRWLLAERRRLEDYTRKQFAGIQQQHQTLLAQHFRNEEALALRTQELNREMSFFASQAKLIQERAAELAKREQALAAQTGKLARAEEEILAQRERSRSGSDVPGARNALLEELRVETARIQKPTDGGLAEVQHALEERQAAWEAKQTEITERVAQMDRRYQELEKAEASAHRRLGELDELELRLEREFERQERQLALERRSIEALRARLRLRGIDPDALNEDHEAAGVAAGGPTTKAINVL